MNNNNDRPVTESHSTKKYSLVGGKNSIDVVKNIVEDVRGPPVVGAAAAVGVLAENKYGAAAFVDIVGFFDEMW